jgi:hypothetical protein
VAFGPVSEEREQNRNVLSVSKPFRDEALKEAK